MINKIITRHPSIHYADELAHICNPLKLLNINYFAHVNVDVKKRFSAISSNPYFTEHYLRNHYYNADIHMAEKNLGKYVIWDYVNLGGRSQQMHMEAGGFGIKHTFTITQKNDDGSSDFYHFASNVPHHSINQIYLSRLDLLKIFILQFKEQISKAKHLSSAYDLKIAISENLSSYSMEQDCITSGIKSDFIKLLLAGKESHVATPFVFDLRLNQILSHREQECLHFLVRGKSAREIAVILGLSKRTIETYLDNIKIKMNVSTKSEVIEKVMNNLTNISL